MDEEQGLTSPIAGGLRGIRRSVSSSIFRPTILQQASPETVSVFRPSIFQQPKPDPETTALLTQNSLSLERVSTQLEAINGQISNLGNSLSAVKENLALSDTIERQRERERQRREAILAEQGLREGKERQIESKIQKALLSPVRFIAQKTQGILARLGQFLLILAAGWLTDKVLKFFSLQTQGNAEAMRKFKIEFLSSLLFFGGTLALFKVGLLKLGLGIKAIGATILKIGVSGLLTVGFKSATSFVSNTITKLRAFIISGAKILQKGAGAVASIAKNANKLIFGGLFADLFIKFGKKINDKLPKFLKFEKVTQFFDNAKKLSNKVPFSGILNSLFALSSFSDRKQQKQSNTQAILGAGAETAGFIAATKLGTAIGTFFFPGPGSIAGGILGGLLSIVGSFLIPGVFGDIMDKITGANKVDPNKSNKKVEKENTEETSDSTISEIIPISSSEVISIMNPNKKKDTANIISSLNDSPEITTIPLNIFNKQSQEIASSSKKPAKSSLNISAEDKNNPYVVFAEAEFNMF